MTGGDWVWILIMAGFLILVFCLDGLRRVEDREADRARRASSHAQLMREIKGKP